jgi:uncharacterized protein (TIGR02598 family)
MAEVMVAVGVLTVAFLGLITVLGTGHSDISRSGRDTAAAVAIQSLVENMQNQPPTELQQLDGMTTEDPTYCPGTSGSRVHTLCTDWIGQVTQLPQGRGTITVAQIPNPTTGIMLRRITITVNWTEATKGARSFTMVVGRSD